MTSPHRLDPILRVALHDLGISAANVLRRAGLPTDLLARPSPAVTTEGYFRFWEAVGAEAGSPSVGVKFGRLGAYESFSPPLLAALASPNLTMALHRVARFKALIGPVTMDVRSDDKGTSITLRGKGLPMPTTLALAELSYWVHLACRATREAVRPDRATLPHPPDDATAVEDALGVRVQTSADTSLTFSLRDAVRPFLTADAETWGIFEPVLERRLSQMETETSLAERVDALLVEMLPSGRRSVEVVAEALAMSPRTLQRHLRQENTTFQRVLDATRERIARHLVTVTDLPTAEIALLLGYDDPSSFYRAFRTWTGTTPQRLRATLAK